VHSVECDYVEDTNYTLAAGMEPVPVVDTAVIGESGIEKLDRLVGPPDYATAVQPFNAWLANSDPSARVDCCEWASRADAEEAGTESARYTDAYRVYLEAFGCVGDPECAQKFDNEVVVEAFASIYNRGNTEALASLFVDTAILTNHPQAATADGKEAVLVALDADRTAATAVDPLVVSNTVVDGNAVTWDHVWTAADGTAWCGTGNVAQTSLGQITSWDFAADHQPCDS
jgi:hypothetical protein